MYQDYTVRVTFVEIPTGSVEYVFPYVFAISDPEPMSKDVIIEGTRADGSIRIPGGKKSHIITVKGNIVDQDGYKDLTTKITAMRTALTTDLGVLTMEHLEGAVWISDWSYNVVRNDEIQFSQSMRTGLQEYSASYLVINY